MAQPHFFCHFQGWTFLVLGCAIYTPCCFGLSAEDLRVGKHVWRLGESSKFSKLKGVGLILCWFCLRGCAETIRYALVFHVWSPFEGDGLHFFTRCCAIGGKNPQLVLHGLQHLHHLLFLIFQWRLCRVRENHDLEGVAPSTFLIWEKCRYLLRTTLLDKKRILGILVHTNTFRPRTKV